MNAPANSMDVSNPGDRLLVTGASGFVGSAISNAARAAGYRVRVLVRRSSPRTNIAPTDDVVVGDICDRASLVAALRGVRYLAHAAADYRLWSPDPTTSSEPTWKERAASWRRRCALASSASSIPAAWRRSNCGTTRRPTKPVRSRRAR